MTERPGQTGTESTARDKTESLVPEVGRIASDPGGAHGKGYSADPPDAPIGPHVAEIPAYELKPDPEEE